MFTSCGAVPAIFAVIFSTALIVWVAGKADVCCAKFAKFIGWVMLVLSLLILIWSIVMCVYAHSMGGCPMKGGMMGPGPQGMEMMRPMHMGRGMMPMQMPPEAPAPEKK